MQTNTEQQASNNGVGHATEPIQQVLQKLNDPSTAASLGYLLDHAQLLALLVAALEGVIQRGEELTDNIGASLREFGGITQHGHAANGHNRVGAALEQMPQFVNDLPALMKASNKVATLSQSKEFDALLVPERLAMLKQLADRISQPETLSALNQLIEHAPLLALLVGGVDGFVKRGEQLADNVGDTLRELNAGGAGTGLAGVAAQLPQLMQNLPSLLKAGNTVGALAETKAFNELLDQQRVASLVQLHDMISEPQTQEALAQLVKHLPLLALLTNGLDGVVRRGEELTDNLANTLRELNPNLKLPFSPSELSAITAQLPELIGHLPALLRAGNKVAEVTESEEFNAFLNSGMLAPQTVELLGAVGQTVVATEKQFRQSPKEVTLFGLLKEMKDPDVQRGIGFVVELGRNFGKMLAK